MVVLCLAKYVSRSLAEAMAASKNISCRQCSFVDELISLLEKGKRRCKY